MTVPYAFKELMEKDELYPTGWSHRKFFPPKRNNNGESGNSQPNKRQNVDPIAALIENDKGVDNNAQ